MPASAAERELSPFSARRLLTLRLNEEKNRPQSAATKSRSRSRSRDTTQSKNGPQRGRQEASVISPSRNRWDTAQEATQTREPRDRPKHRAPKDPLPEERAAHHNRDASPEPYRRPRDGSRSRKQDRSRSRHKHRDRDRSKDRRRDRSIDKRRDRSRSRDRRRDRSKDRRRDRSREHKRPRSTDRHRSRSRSRDTDRKRRDRRHSPSSSPPPKRTKRPPSPPPRSKKPLPSQELSFRGTDNSAQRPSKYGGAPPDKEKPNFKTTGALAKAANRVEGTKISLKYHEPPEARKPPSSAKWRLFVFKGDDMMETVELCERSCWLLGREQLVADILLEHPSASGQHAVIQFRYIEKTVQDEFGVKERRGKVKPYVIDLESSNGTELNGDTLETSRYFELRDKDILKFAGSEREYVVMLPPRE